MLTQGLQKKSNRSKWIGHGCGFHCLIQRGSFQFLPYWIVLNCAITRVTRDQHVCFKKNRFHRRDAEQRRLDSSSPARDFEFKWSYLTPNILCKRSLNISRYHAFRPTFWSHPNDPVWSISVAPGMMTWILYIWIPWFIAWYMRNMSKFHSDSNSEGLSCC